MKDKIVVDVDKDLKKKIEKRAKELELSVPSYIRRLIRFDLEGIILAEGSTKPTAVSHQDLKRMIILEGIATEDKTDTPGSKGNKMRKKPKKKQ